MSRVEARCVYRPSQVDVMDSADADGERGAGTAGWCSEWTARGRGKGNDAKGKDEEKSRFPPGMTSKKGNGKSRSNGGRERLG